MLKRVNHPNPSTTGEDPKTYKLRTLKTYKNKAKENSSIPVKILKFIGSAVVTGLAAFGGAIAGSVVPIAGTFAGAVAGGGIAAGSLAMGSSYLFWNKTDKEEKAHNIAELGKTM